MGWKVKTDMGVEAKHGLLESNVTTRKYLPRGCWEQISCTFLGLKVISLGQIN